ncbi:MAG: hypothetical protein GY765_26160, partial [bacterium]|nr:hypothetical protein [bacterium]
MNRKNGLHVIMTLLFILCQLPLFSAVLTVTTTEDEVAGSLRETIAVAAENGERNVIYLPAGHYVLNPWTSGGEPSTIYIDIPKTDNINLYIIGEDADSTIIDVDNRDRAFEILSGKVYISDITIQNSTPDDGVTDRTQNGGAIHNKGELALVRCKLINNSSGSDQITYAQGFRGGKGGAIYNDVDAEMVIDRCVISGNYTRGGRTGDFDQNPGGDGGGIYNRGDMEIANSLITNNSTGEGGDGGSGGGIFHSTGYLKISASSIANNSTGPGQRSFGPLPPLRITSGGDGGGLYIESGKVDMVNCTVSGNGTGRGMMEAYTTLLGGAGYGGGIAVNDGELSLNLCTVLDNSTGAGALNENSSKTATGDGGGIYVYYGAEANIENSIVALNTVGTLGVGTNGKGAINSEGYNLFGDTADLSLLGDLTGNLTGVDPLVEPLAYNSAFTLTHALKAGSPAIDAGNAEHIYDQRNFRRDTDSTITPSGSDIGAYEFNASAEGFLHIDKKILTFSADTAGNISGDKTVTISRDSIWVIYTAPYHSLVSFDKVSGEGAEQVTISPQPLQDNPREPGTYVAHFPVRTTSGMIYENNIIVIVDVIDSEATSAPFGSFDTPASGSTVSSSIPVTGWALDDIGIESIKIYRDPAAGEGSDRVYLGDAMQVENARPDLASSYPSYPGSTKAGWGYM